MASIQLTKADSNGRVSIFIQEDFIHRTGDQGRPLHLEIETGCGRAVLNTDYFGLQSIVEVLGAAVNAFGAIYRSERP